MSPAFPSQRDTLTLPTQAMDTATATAPLHESSPLQANANIVNGDATRRLRQLQQLAKLRATDQTPEGIRRAGSSPLNNLGNENRRLYEQKRSPKQIATYNELRMHGIPANRIVLDPRAPSYVQPQESLKRTITHGDAPTLSLRMLHGANPNETDTRGTPAIVTAAALGKLAAVRILAGARADLAATDAYQRNALLAASAAGQAEVVTELLPYFPPLDATDAAGMSALMHLCVQGHAEAVSLMLSHGADSTLLSRDGMTACDLARHHGHPDIADRIDASLRMTDDSGEAADLGEARSPDQ